MASSPTHHHSTRFLERSTSVSNKRNSLARQLSYAFRKNFIVGVLQALAVAILVIASTFTVLSLGHREEQGLQQVRQGSGGAADHDHHKGHSCAHFSYVAPRLEKLHREREAGYDAMMSFHQKSREREGRVLAEDVEAPIRIVPFYELPNTISQEQEEFVKNVIIPNATRFFERAIRVRRRVEVPLVLTLTCRKANLARVDGVTTALCAEHASRTCLDADIPLEHIDAHLECDDNGQCLNVSAGPGVPNADFVLYVTAKETEGCSGNTVAYAGSCIQDPDTDRPVAGNVNFCQKFFAPKGISVQNRLTIAIHELTHALVFNPTLFYYFRDDQGNPLRERVAPGVGSSFLKPLGGGNPVVQEFQERGSTVRKVVTPRVKAMAQQHFGCPTLNGAELENNGGNSTAGSHWEARVWSGEVMEGLSHGQQQSYSNITLALLDDSGWYRANYEVSGALSFGRGRGCDFALASCNDAAAVPAFVGYTCDTTNLQMRCTPDGIMAGDCVSCADSETAANLCFDDGCSRVDGLGMFACMDPSSIARTMLGQVSGPGARCLPQGPEPWTVKGTDVSNVGAGCFNSRCTRDATTGTTTLQVEVREGVWVTCVDGQMVPLPSPFSSGTLGPCPVATTFCGQLNCPADCSGNGECLDGVCYCQPGFAGPSCSEVQCFPSSCSNGSVCALTAGVCQDAVTRQPLNPSGTPAPPPSPPSSSSSSGTAHSAILMTVIKFSGISLTSPDFSSEGLQTGVSESLLGAAGEAARSTSFFGNLEVVVMSVREGVTVRSLVQFSPTGGMAFKDAQDASRELQKRLQNSPATIFQKNGYFRSVDSIVTLQASTYQGSTRSNGGASYLNKANSFIRRLYKKPWFIFVVVAVAALLVLCAVYGIVKWCCTKKSSRYK